MNVNLSRVLESSLMLRRFRCWSPPQEMSGTTGVARLLEVVSSGSTVAKLSRLTFTRLLTRGLQSLPETRKHPGCTRAHVTTIEFGSHARQPAIRSEFTMTPAPYATSRGKWDRRFRKDRTSR